MSEADRSEDGAARATVTRSGPLGMVLIRGDLAEVRLRYAVGQAAGVDVPDPLGATGTPERGLLWFSPDELLLLAPRDEAAGIAAALAEKLAGLHHMAEDVSDARVAFRVEGGDRAVRETLARLTPADVSPAAAPDGRVRRTRIGQVPAAIRFGSGRADVYVFRSVADYAEGLLSGAARGAPLGLYRADS